MEALQAQLASDLNSNCYLVLMNEVLKSSWLIEYNRNNNGKLSSEAAVPADAGDARPVIEIDDNGLEHERSFFHTSDLKKTVPFTWSGQESKDAFLAHKQQHFIAIPGDATENRSVQPYEREKDSAVTTSIAPRGPYQRPARIIQSPDWLPDGWTTEIRIREWGNTAGTKDKYYVDPTNGRRFRSKKEVMEYIQTGNLSRWKRKAKPAELDSYPVAASVARMKGSSPEASSNPVKSCSPHFASPVKQIPAFSQSWPIPPLAWEPLPVSNNYVAAISVPHKTGDCGKICSARSWHSSNQQNVFDKGPCTTGHTPQLPIKVNFVPHVAVRPQPVEIIDLEAIPDTTLSIETRSVSGYPNRLNLPKGLSLPFAGTKGPQAKDFSSQLQRLHRDIQHTPNQQKHLHSGVNTLGGMTQNIVEGCQVPTFGISYGGNSFLEDSSKRASTYASCVGGDTVYTNLAGDSFGGFETTSSFHNKRSLNVSQISSLPSLGGSTPLLWQYQMLLPSFAGNGSLSQTFCQVQPSARSPDENDNMVETKICGRVQLHNSNELSGKNNITRSLFPDQSKTPLSFPLKAKKLQKLKRHQEKKQLELLGRKLCRQGLAFVQNQLSCQHSYVKSNK